MFVSHIHSGEGNCDWRSQEKQSWILDGGIWREKIHKKQGSQEQFNVRLYASHSVFPLQPKDSSPASSSVYGIFQARILKWVAISSSRGSSQPRVEPASPVSPALQVDSLPTCCEVKNSDSWKRCGITHFKAIDLVFQK